MTDNQPKVRAVSAPWHTGVELLVLQGENVGVRVVMEPAGEGEAVGPTLTISRDDAQTLMDDLWNTGLRPTEGTGSAGALSATQAHLQDMRQLTFKLLKIKWHD